MPTAPGLAEPGPKSRRLRRSLAVAVAVMVSAAPLAAFGQSEALRRSRLAMLADPEKPAYAHPRFWTPFVVVGEGGR